MGAPDAGLFGRLALSAYRQDIRETPIASPPYPGTYMRLTTRLAGGIALLFGVISCSSSTDGLTASRSSSVLPARLAIEPAFSPAAAQAYAALLASGADITDIHIVLTDLGGHVAADTVVPFPVGRDSISIDLALSIQGREQQFVAQVDLRDASGVIQFSVTQRVTARNSSRPSLPQSPLVLRYVGPGFGARSVAVSPGDATLLPGATQNVIATGADASGVSIGNLLVVWTSSDSTIARVTSTAAAAALVTARGPRGTATITARTLAGIAGTARITVQPQASTLSTITGAGQSGAALDTLPTPFTVELRGTDGGTVSGVLVTFSAVTATGTVLTGSVATDAAGRASTRMVLGREPGAYTYQAVSGALQAVTVTQTATVALIGAATQLIPLTPLPSSFTAGVAASQRFSAQLADAKGSYVRKPGVVMTATMDITTNAGVTSRRVVTATSDADGVITLTIPAFEVAGHVLITLTVPDISLTLSGTFAIN